MLVMQLNTFGHSKITILAVIIELILSTFAGSYAADLGGKGDIGTIILDNMRLAVALVILMLFWVFNQRERDDFFSLAETKMNADL